MKKCPYCAEEIRDEAILCRFCKSDLTYFEDHTKQIAPKKETKQLLEEYNQEDLEFNKKELELSKGKEKKEGGQLSKIKNIQ